MANGRKMKVLTFLPILILYMLASIPQSVNGGCAKIIDINDKNLIIDKKKYPYIVKKFLKLRNTTIHTILSKEQYEMTHTHNFDAPHMGFSNFKRKGTYH